MRSCEKKTRGVWPGGTRTGLVAAAFFLTAGCERYRSRPLVPEEIAASVERERALPDDAKGAFTFARAADLLASRGPALREARAAYETSRAVAGIRTPLPNPSLEIGPQFGFGGAVDGRRVQPFGSIGFSVPTGSRRRDQDDLNRARAEAARIEWILRHRESFLVLRERYAGLVLARRRLDGLRDHLAGAEASAAAAGEWAGAGRVPATEAVVRAAEAERFRADAAEAATDLVREEAALSRLLGASPSAFADLPERPLAGLPESLPGEEALKAFLVAHHPDLARLRAAYDVAERELRVEIARQYPDFRFGPEFSGEVGEEKQVLGLSLGMDLPVFDRNRQGIAEAKGRREEIRVRYEAALSRLLASVEEAKRAWTLAAGRRRILAGTALASAEAGADLARRLVAAGAADPAEFLEAGHRHREAEIEAERSVRESWVAFFRLEQSVGCPLMPFPDEPAGLFPPSPHGPDQEGTER